MVKQSSAVFFNQSVMKSTKKKYLFLLLFYLFATGGFAQTFTEKWATCLGGTEWDEAEGIMQAD